MNESVCKKCGFSKPAYRGKLWCQLAHYFVENLGDFCPKNLSVEKIRESCRYYLSPEKTESGKPGCWVHAIDQGVHLCWVKELEDLLKDPDFTPTLFKNKKEGS